MPQVIESKIELKPYQADFFASRKRYPALVAGIGTGKTMVLLLKIWNFCVDHPNTLALVVRKEYTDLRDSTLKDFKRYFNVGVNSDKEYHFGNGSVIMFRHGAELNVLKNINLTIFGIEQAEEFETEEIFTYLRDRLRRDNAPYRQGCIIANANGHNWVWKMWKHNPTDDEYAITTATTFDNEDNLPADFIADLKRMEKDAPNHYKRFVLNSFEETEEDDYVFRLSELEEARKREYVYREGYGLRITGFDIARYGNDKCAAVCIQQIGALIWKVHYIDQWEKKDLDYTTGRILATAAELNSEENIIDEDGIGAGPLDTINKGRGYDYKGFRNKPLSYDQDQFYGNPRTANAFRVKDMIVKGHISLAFEELVEEMLTLKYKYMNDGRRILISKEKMRLDGFKSPNLADALIMAVSRIGKINYNEMREIGVLRRSPQYSKEENLFQLGGIR